jgi:alpha-aminoadipic semialdehyde synthase
VKKIMTYYIGIRRESKPGERRTPLTPKAVKKLKQAHDIQTILQPHEERAFSDEEYLEVGGIVQEDLSNCQVIFGIKEMDLDIFKKNKAYMCFHHVIKGQKSNMPMLKYMMKTGATMLDYEKVVDENNHRLIFFGKHAGYAGMIDTLYGLGIRLQEVDGLATPFLEIKQSCDYFDLQEAKTAIKKVKETIQHEGLPKELCPIVIGFLGYGNVSQGAQSILDFLPVKEVAPEDLADLVNNPDEEECKKYLYKVIFKEEHMVEPKDSATIFDLQDYYDHPEKYKGVFAKKYLRYLTVIVNGAYWSSKYPRSITKQDIKELYSADNPPRLRIIGDISCDLFGGIECTMRISYIDRPFYVYDTITDSTIDGIKGKGPAILAIDHLPTEIPRDASEFFSETLLPFIPTIAKANYNGTLDEANFTPEIEKSVILWKGELTKSYQYIQNFLD